MLPCFYNKNDDARISYKRSTMRMGMVDNYSLISFWRHSHCIYQCSHLPDRFFIASVHSFQLPGIPSVANNPDHDDCRAYGSLIASSHLHLSRYPDIVYRLVLHAPRRPARTVLRLYNDKTDGSATTTSTRTAYLATVSKYFL